MNSVLKRFCFCEIARIFFYFVVFWLEYDCLFDNNIHIQKVKKWDLLFCGEISEENLSCLLEGSLGAIGEMILNARKNLNIQKDAR